MEMFDATTAGGATSTDVAPPSYLDLKAGFELVGGIEVQSELVVSIVLALHSASQLHRS
jgi:hypothetical protein